MSWETKQKVVDAAWSAAVASTLASGLVIASMFTIGWAEGHHVIPMPQQPCHYESWNQALDNWCR